MNGQTAQGKYTGQTRRLTGKEKQYIANIASGMTRREAVKQAYDVKPNVAVKTLDNMAGRIEKRDVVMAVLNAHEEEAQSTVVDVMKVAMEHGRSGTKEGAQYARVALDGANSLLDRVHGKAKQQVEVQSTSVTIAIDLTGEQDDREIIEQN